ncbi:hypothetical protein QBC35DRAFT_506414 [Podospora australis]|uniref:Monooxygenase n=1 Tax=Podospora australis TaxID=1536484 RepID=A0AAN7AFS1_9PEZI|nr:hypothetical protein QBC35DRAFT_506414 [Podospora australis]
MMAALEDEIPYTQFACIGTGFSGIALGATLVRWYGISSLALFESQPKLGGTWQINRYPGAACDVPSALYSFSFERNPNWTRFLPPHDELQLYLTKVAEKYGLLPLTQFSTKVVKAQWNEPSSRWILTLHDLTSNTFRKHSCQFLFSGTGQFSTPRPLDIPGVESFSGPIIHSARWPSPPPSLEGKKVVVFGNGCTAAQIVPAILPETKSLTQIARSKHWIYPPVDAKMPEIGKAILRSLPGATMLQRYVVYFLAEADWAGFSLTPSAAKFREKRRKMAVAYIKATAPEKYHDLLIPEFEIGCKRRIFDSGYLAALHDERLELTTEKAVEIQPTGVKMEGGRVVEADVIILANGFQTNKYLGGLEVVGRNGERLEEHWKKFGGPEAYNLTSVSGFPNLFLLLGPNTATGHTSTVMVIENAVNYALRVIRPILEGKAEAGSAVDVKPEAEKAYFHRIQTALQNTVWTTGCNSWYVRGEGGKMYNGMTYPWSQRRYWYECLFPVWKDWEYSGKPGKRTIVKSQKRPVMCMATFAVAAVSGLLAWVSRNPNSRLAAVLLAARLGTLDLWKSWAVGLLTQRKK